MAEKGNEQGDRNSGSTIRVRAVVAVCSVRTSVSDSKKVLTGWPIAGVGVPRSTR